MIIVMISSPSVAVAMHRLAEASQKTYLKQVVVRFGIVYSF
jgi:hypothetical protein